MGSIEFWTIVGSGGFLGTVGLVAIVVKAVRWLRGVDRQRRAAEAEVVAVRKLLTTAEGKVSLAEEALKHENEIAEKALREVAQHRTRLDDAHRSADMLRAQLVTATKAAEEAKKSKRTVDEVEELDPVGAFTSNGPELREGDEGNEDEVRAAQRALRDLGYYVNKVDGSFGPKLREAVKNFQADYDLKVGGAIGPKTRAAIVEALEEGV